VKILIATRNPGKLREYRDLLADLPTGTESLEWVLLTDIGIEVDVEETGTTFEENARLKAAAYSQMSGLLTLADDSGLEVDALGGSPGVRSARYAGPGASDSDRYQKLLRELEGVPSEARTARFRCVVAVSTPEGEIHTASGDCPGQIAFEPRGSFGFGYDPVFYMPDRGLTMAELPPEIKNRISHRARALEAIKPTLSDLISRFGGG
jgi:XTP/dITP diphosphohydrolase